MYIFFREIDNKKYEAYVKKKEQAEKEYQEALESGETAAHVGVRLVVSDGYKQITFSCFLWNL